MKAWVRKTCVLLSASVALVVGGVANTGSASAQPATTSESGLAAATAGPLAIPPCVTRLPPTGGFLRDVRYSQPNACRKCQEAGAYYESRGKWDAHCQNILNPAGTVTAVQLWPRCIACRSTAPALRSW